MIMWRENGDLTMLYRVIKTVNYLNRLIFDPQDYFLGSKKKPVNTSLVENIVQTDPAQISDGDQEIKKDGSGEGIQS